MYRWYKYYVKPAACLYLGPNTPKGPILFKTEKTWYFWVKSWSSANEVVLEQEKDDIFKD